MYSFTFAAFATLTSESFQKIPEGSDQRTEYRKLCFEIIAVLKGNRELCEMESMRFWATWCPP